MKSLKMVQGLILVSSLFMGSAYAQSALRADEVKASPGEYRLGDSDDLQKDQMIVEQNKVCENIKHQQHILNKHLLKYEI